MIVEIICPLTLDCYLALPPAFHPKYQVLLAEDTRRLRASVTPMGAVSDPATCNCSKAPVASVSGSSSRPVTVSRISLGPGRNGLTSMTNCALSTARTCRNVLST